MTAIAWRWLLVVLALGFEDSTRAAVLSAADQSPLAKWLYNVSLDLDAPVLGKMRCTHFSINKLKSAYTPSAHSLTVSAAPLGVDCFQVEDKWEIAATITVDLEVAVSLDWTTPKNSLFDVKAHTLDPDVKVIKQGKKFTPALHLLVDFIDLVLGKHLVNFITGIVLGMKKKSFESTVKNLEQYLKPPSPQHHNIPKVPAVAFNNPDNGVIKLVEYVSHIVNETFDELVDGAETLHHGDASIPLNLGQEVVIAGHPVLLELKHVSVNGLDNVSSILLATPSTSDPQMLQSALSLLGFEGGVTFNIVVFGLDNATLLLNETSSARFSLSRLQADLSTYLALDSKKISALSDPELIKPECLLSTLEGGKVTLLDVTSADLEFKASDREGNLEEQIADLVNAGFQLVVGATGGKSTDLLRGFVAENVTAMVNTALQGIVNTPHNCTEPSTKDLGDKTSTLILLAVACVVSALLVYFLPVTDSLMTHPNIPWYVRFSVFLILLLSLMQVISGTVATLSVAKVRIAFSDTGSSIVESLKFITFGDLLKDFWDAQVYTLAIANGVGAGVVPFVRLAVCFGCWLLPTTWLSLSRRGLFLSIMTHLGKAVLIQFFIAALLATAIHITFYVPNARIDTYIEGAPALAYNFFATLLGLFGPLLMLSYHREVAAEHYEGITSATNPDAQSAPVGELTYKIGSKERRVSNGVRVVVSVLLALAGLLIMIACGLPFVRFKQAGAAEVVTEFLNEPTAVSYTFFDLGAKLRIRAVNHMETAAILLSVIYITFALLVPLLLSLFSLVLWLKPLTVAYREHLFVLVEALHSVCGLEVLLVAVIAGVLQLQPYVNYVFGDQCASVNAFLAANFDKQLHGDAKCVDLEGQFLVGFPILLVACVLLFVCSRFVIFVGVNHVFPTAQKGYQPLQ